MVSRPAEDRPVSVGELEQAQALATLLRFLADALAEIFLGPRELGERRL